MSDLARTVAALAERVAVLESENQRQRTSERLAPAATIVGRTPSRRSLLAGGAGLLSAVVATTLAAPGFATAAPACGSAGAVQARQYAAPVLLGTRVTLVPQRGGGHHWARYEWDLDQRFTGEEPPAVLAAAADDYHGTAEQAEPTVAVAVHREDGVWRAEILVNHVGHLATEVTLQAIAFGSSE